MHDVNQKVRQNFGHREYAVLFFVMAALCTWQTISVEAHLQKAMLASASVALWGLTIAYSRADASVLMKRAVGTISPAGYLVFAPYHLLNAVLLRVSRWFSREEPLHEIVPGLFLGGRLLRCDEPRIKDAKICAVLDLAGEFSELPCLRRCGNYRSIPVMDACAPPYASLDAGVDWIREAHRNGPVYVHCASGHGRSALFVAAYLLSTGVVSTAADAELYLRARRSGVALRRWQREALRVWWAAARANRVQAD
jgi:hypothetical protein